MMGKYIVTKIKILTPYSSFGVAYDIHKCCSIAGLNKPVL